MAIANNDIIDYLADIMPVDREEIDGVVAGNVLQSTIRKCLRDMDRYYPNYRLHRQLSGVYDLRPDETFLYAYALYNQYEPDYGVWAAKEHPTTEQVRVLEPAFIKLRVNWSLTNVDKTEESKQVFFDLIEIRLKEHIANRRRTITDDAVGFNLRGDEFYGEAKEEIKEYLEALQMRNTGF